MNHDLHSHLEADLREAERKAWDALARWKFWMFGYHAADVVKIKRRLGRGREPFFKELVEAARKVMHDRYDVRVGASPEIGTEHGRASLARSTHPAGDDTAGVAP